jgi:hypothetical protein
MAGIVQPRRSFSFLLVSPQVSSSALFLSFFYPQTLYQRTAHRREGNTEMRLAFRIRVVNSRHASQLSQSRPTTWLNPLSFFSKAVLGRHLASKTAQSVGACLRRMERGRDATASDSGLLAGWLGGWQRQACIACVYRVHLAICYWFSSAQILVFPSLLSGKFSFPCVNLVAYLTDFRQPKQTVFPACFLSCHFRTLRLPQQSPFKPCAPRPC